MRSTSIGVLAPLAIVVCMLANPARAGQLDPDPGPVAPTMRTLQEIYDAITSLSGGQLADDRVGAPWIAQGRAAAFLELTGINGPDTTPDGVTSVFRVIDFDDSFQVAFDLNGNPAATEFGQINLVKEIDERTPALLVDLPSGANYATASILFYDSETQGSAPTFIIDLTNAMLTRNDIVGGPAGGEQHHLHAISLFFDSLVDTVPGPVAVATGDSIAAPGGPVAPTMHTLDEIGVIIDNGIAMDDRTVGPEFIAQPRLLAYLDIPFLSARSGVSTPDGRFRDVIPVLEFSLPLSIEPPTQGGGQGGTPLPDFGNLRIVKELDLTSAELRFEGASGTLIPEATLHVYTDSPGGPREYFRVALQEVYLARMNSERRAYGRILRHVETLEMRYDRIRWSFFPSGGGEIRTGWDVENNVPF